MPKKPKAQSSQTVQQSLNTSYVEQQLRGAVFEQMQQEIESLKLYTPIAYQDAFHRCRAKLCVIQKGNRVGGSVANMVEVARAVTGQDPYNKYPKENGRAVVLGYGEKHIGRVFHRLLFQPGAFDIIRDEKTKRWRTYRPWPKSEGGDEHRESEKRPARPLIPKRFIKSIAWEKRSEKVFSVVTFTTGWELHAMNSSGDPGQAQGFDAHLYAIDEDLATGGWYEEAVGRIAAVGGLLRWSALPHARNNDLIELLELAEDEKVKPEPKAVTIRASIFDNPYLKRDSVAQSVEAWKAKGDDVYRKRVMGEIAIDNILMYPTYNRRVHSAIRRENETKSVVQQIMEELAGEPPADWTRFMFADPGHTVLAIYFFATPPPELSHQRVCYAEAYCRNATSAEFGDALDMFVKDKVFEKFVIDSHGGALTEIGSGRQPIEYYVDELIARNLKSSQTGSAFAIGVDRHETREEALRNWFSINRNGEPTILIVNERCPNLCIEIERFRKLTTRIAGKDWPTDKGNRKANTHGIDCLEMAAADGLEYVKPRSHAIQPAWVDQVLAREAKRQAVANHMGAIFGGNHISLGPQGVPVR